MAPVPFIFPVPFVRNGPGPVHFAVPFGTFATVHSKKTGTNGMCPGTNFRQRSFDDLTSTYGSGYELIILISSIA